MKIKKIIVTIVAFLGLVSLTSVIWAKGIFANEDGQYHPVVAKLVERFNLNADEVQEVFDEVHEERYLEKQARFEEKLEEAVVEGKITQDQKAAILEKHEEMHQKHQEMRGLLPQERKEAMMEYKREIKDWAEENGIDFGSLFMFGYKGFGKHKMF